MQWIGFSRDQCLERSDQETTDYDRVNGLVRPGAVPALSPHVNGECIGLGRHVSITNHDLARLPLVSDMCPEYRGDAIESAIGNGDSRTPATLFRWLKDEPYGPGWRLLRQEMCSADQHRHMSAVAAGMHRARIDRCVGRTGSLLARQRIHVCTKRDCQW